MERIEQLIDLLNLQKHPEGGYFKETYRSEGVIPSEVLKYGIDGDRNYCTGIYFLLTSDNFLLFIGSNRMKCGIIMKALH